MDKVLLKQRDRYSIEIKARYLIDPSQLTRKGYGLRVYFFFPQPFRVSRSTYDSQSFFSQLKLYLRFNTPVFSVEELLEPLSDVSPLVRIEKMLHRRKTGEEFFSEERAFIYESKLLGSVYKSILRELLNRARSDGGVRKAGKAEEAKLEESIKSMHAVARRFHEVAEELERLEPDAEVLQHARMIDEHLSLLLEKYLTSVLSLCDEDKQEDLYGRIVKVLLKEEKHRAERGYPSQPSKIERQQQFEEYVYREKMLKKYASEVLFFDVDRRDTAKRGEHVLYAVAAGIAMVLATTIAFYGQTRFGNFSVSLFALLVVGYMLKDRVKDFFREVLKRRLGPHLNDRKSRIQDRRRRKRLATVSERAYYVKEAKLDPAIRELRDRGYFERTLFAEEEEKILLYAKRLNLNGRNLSAVHSRINGVADINMVDLSPFLRHLSAQYGLVPTVENKKRVSLKRVKRIYHLNVIVAHDSPDGRIAGRFRLVVDAQGIKRIEPVEPRGPLSNDGVKLVPRSMAEEEGEYEY